MLIGLDQENSSTFNCSDCSDRFIVNGNTCQNARCELLQRWLANHDPQVRVAWSEATPERKREFQRFIMPHNQFWEENVGLVTGGRAEFLLAGKLSHRFGHKQVRQILNHRTQVVSDSFIHNIEQKTDNTDEKIDEICDSTSHVLLWIGDIRSNWDPSWNLQSILSRRTSAGLRTWVGYDTRVEGPWMNWGMWPSFSAVLATLPRLRLEDLSEIIQKAKTQEDPTSKLSAVYKTRPRIGDPQVSKFASSCSYCPNSIPKGGDFYWAAQVGLSSSPEDKKKACSACAASATGQEAK